MIKSFASQFRGFIYAALDFTTTKRIFPLMLLMAALATVSFAQDANRPGVLAQEGKKDAQAGPLSTDVCQSTFTSGSGDSYMSFCVTQNGNIGNFYSPANYSQLYAGAEGYAVCDVSSNYSYHDWGRGGDSGNWLDSSVIQPNGPNTFPLTVKRTTSDGIWTLTQAFSRSTTAPSVKITMALRNNSAVGKWAYFERFADIDGGGIYNNLFDGGTFSVWGYVSGRNGLLMRGSSTPSGMGAWVVSGYPADPCSPQHQGLPYIGDGAGLTTWEPYLSAKSSKTVTVEYRPIY
jgi:hypothetical protein